MRDPFRVAEFVAYAILGLLLAAAALIGLAGAGRVLWEALGRWDSTESIFQLMDRLLFVLMLVEILHTVGVSVRTGSLLCEPFLIVGIIASIRRILVITLESSELMKGDKWTMGGEAVFRASMLELGILAGLILVLVVAIHLLRRSDSSESVRAEEVKHHHGNS